MSPIRGLTDATRLPRIGKIHLGTKQKKEGGREYPKASSHFIVRADDTTPAEAAEAFAAIYGPESSEIDIVFPSDDPLQWADANYKSWSSWGVRCRGDGETALAKWDATGKGPRPEGVESGTWANPDTKEGAWAYLQIPCAGEDCPMQRFSPPKCKMVMNLQFLLPDVAGVGVWQIDTSSKHSVLNILNNVRLIQALTGGRIRGLPLRLRLVPKQVTPDGGKTKTVYVLDIYAALTLTELMRRVAALPERGLIQLPAPDDAVPDDLFPDVDEETGEILEAESIPVEEAPPPAFVKPDPPPRTGRVKPPAETEADAAIAEAKRTFYAAASEMELATHKGIHAALELPCKGAGNHNDEDPNACQQQSQKLNALAMDGRGAAGAWHTMEAILRGEQDAPWAPTPEPAEAAQAALSE